jgi:hypothetical protein
MRDLARETQACVHVWSCPSATWQKLFMFVGYVCMMASHARCVEKSPPPQHMVHFRCRQKSFAVQKKSTAEVVNKKEASFRLVHVAKKCLVTSNI